MVPRSNSFVLACICIGITKGPQKPEGSFWHLWKFKCGYSKWDQFKKYDNARNVTGLAILACGRSIRGPWLSLYHIYVNDLENEAKIVEPAARRPFRNDRWIVRPYIQISCPERRLLLSVFTTKLIYIVHSKKAILNHLHWGLVIQCFAQ